MSLDNMSLDKMNIAEAPIVQTELPADETTKWWAISEAQALERLGTTRESGLTSTEAKRRIDTYGANRLAEKPTRSPWFLFFGQFKSVLILVLIFAAGLAGAVGNVKDATVILVVVVLNAIVGFWQEYRAEQSLAALKKMLPATTRVRRDGHKREIGAEDVAPGDLVLLEAGDRVPADGRLVAAFSLAIDESALTGESQPVDKRSAALGATDVPLAERHNVAYANTMISRGRGELLITATGMHTEMGRLSQALAEAPENPSPLQVQLDQLGRRLGAVALTLVGLLFFLEWLRGTDLTHMILDAIALSVAAIPEGLPVVVTVTLALGMHQMARQRAIIKRLASVETLGCTTVICSDKTGTLTLNQMTARAVFYREQHFSVSGEGYRADGAIHPEEHGTIVPDMTPLLVHLVACNDSRVHNDSVIGDPTEGALLVLAAKGGMQQETPAGPSRIAEIPFDSAHKFMATFHRDDNHVYEYVKGAPDVLLARCSRFLGRHGDVPLDGALMKLIESEYQALAQRGLRGLLIASRTLAAAEFAPQGDLFPHVSTLTFVALVGLMDPPRPEVKDAIRLCNRAGIAVKMITGDHKDTAAAIARELGLLGQTISGAELDAMDVTQLSERIDTVTVFARVAPEHKVKIVQALKVQGHVVAMTGDGVNDAPALKHADIGIAMGITGTEVSKEAASMILTDDNFATIVSAVRQGRALYDNIVKFLRFQLSTTMGAILSVFFAPLVGLPEPFTPIQILWVALIMDGPPAVSLALDSARPGLMYERPRRRGEPMLSLSRLSRILAFGLIMMAGTLAVMQYGMQSAAPPRAMTLAFTTFVLFQFFNVFNARNENGSSFNQHLFENRMLWVSLASVVVLQVVAVHWPPAQALFQTVELRLADWVLAALVASSVLLLEELRKLALRTFARA